MHPPRTHIDQGLFCKKLIWNLQCNTPTPAWDTIGNAWFTRVMHTDMTDTRKLLVVTSDFHLPRSQVRSPSVPMSLQFVSQLLNVVQRSRTDVLAH